MTIIQPYVAAYRVPLFNLLDQMLAEDGLRLQVLYPGPSQVQADRMDHVDTPWSRKIPSVSMSFRSNRLTWRSTWREVRSSAVAVVELASTNLDTYLIALQRRVPLVLWGHGRAFVKEPNRVDIALERFLARRAAHLLAYTNGGLDALRARGIDPSTVTVVQNATDTAALRAEMATVSRSDVEDLRHLFRIDGTQVALFLGALDKSKRIDILLASALAARRQLPGFQLVIAGNGPLRNQVRDAAAGSEGAIVALSTVDLKTLATLSRVADLVAIPGSIGLVAVDAMTMGLPVVTTNFRYHGPEREYLRPDYTWVSECSESAYTQILVESFRDALKLANAGDQARQDSESFSIESMAERIHEGIVEAIEHPR